jgi:Haem-binding domain
LDRGRVVRGLRRVALVGLVVFVVMQLVPYGWRHPNPPVVAEPVWPDARSEELARAACYDCHSNETDWPVYSYVAPMSWLVRLDVERGRDALNFSEWDEFSGEADDAAEVVADGSMPLDRYVVLHRDADLSAEEQVELATALARLEDATDEAEDAADDAADAAEDREDG